MIQANAPIVSAREVMNGVWLVWLDCAEIAREAKPGQFVMVHCDGDTFLPRPISIHRVDEVGRMGLLVNVVGKGTAWLSARRAGDTVRIFGPLGNGFTVDENVRNLLLVAGGIGVAPLTFLAERAARRGWGVTMLMGAPTSARLCPVEGLPDGCTILNVTQDNSSGLSGMVTDWLLEYAASADAIFACGPMPMYRSINKLGITKPVQVSLEVRMACGRGLCYGCSVPTRNGQKKVCEDGPVFDLNDVMWRGIS